MPDRFVNQLKRFSSSSTKNGLGFNEIQAENTPPIDWRKTKAFAITGNGIYINDIRFKDPLVRTEEEYNVLCQSIIQKLNDLKLPEGESAFPDIVTKVPGKSFGTDGIDIALNANIVSCERPNYSVYSNKYRDYFSKTKKGDVGSHRREGIFIAQGPSFGFDSSRKTFNHTDLFDLILHLNSIELKSTSNLLIRHLSSGLEL